MPNNVIVDHEKLATEVKTKSNTLASQLTARPYNSQKTLVAINTLRLTLNKIAPNRTWGFWRGVFIGLICGCGLTLWYIVANHLLVMTK